MKSSSISKDKKDAGNISLNNNNKTIINSSSNSNISNNNNNSLPKNKTIQPQQKRNINQLSDEIEDIEECEEVVFKSSMMKTSATRNSISSQHQQQSFSRNLPIKNNNSNNISNSSKRLRINNNGHSQSPTSPNNTSNNNISIFNLSPSSNTSNPSSRSTSPNSSSTSINLLQLSRNLDFNEDEDESKFPCIYGEKCTDKSEAHLKDYSHKKKSSTPTSNSTSFTSTPSPSSSSSTLSSAKIYNSIISGLSKKQSNNNNNNNNHNNNENDINHSNNHSSNNISKSDIVNNAILIKKKERPKTEEELEQERIQAEKELELQKQLEEEKKKEEEEILSFSGFENIIKVSPPQSTIDNSNKTLSTTTTTTTTTSTSTISTTSSTLSKKSKPSNNTETIIIDDTVLVKSKPFKSKKEKSIKPIDEKIFDDIEIDFNETFTSSGSTNNLINSINSFNNNYSNNNKNNNLPRQNSFKSNSKNSSINNNNNKNKNNVDNKNKMFIDKHTPNTEADLIVHKTRIDRVKIWLQDRMNEINQDIPLSQKLLFLTGPTGAGKSTLVRVLSQSLDFEIIEWINPPVIITKDVNDEFTTPYSSTMDEFRKWVKYNSQSLSMFSTNTNKILFIEDIPNIITENRLEFLDIFQDFLKNTRFPMVFILSDLFMGNSGLYQLFPASFMSNNSSSIFHVQVNSAAPTYLRRLLQKIAKEEGYGNAVSLPQIESFVEESAGDIRAAIFSLEFFCIGKKSENSSSSSLLKLNKQKQQRLGLKNSGSSSNNHTKEDDLKVSGILSRNRDSILTLFHSVGKILYNKRIPNSNPYIKGESWYKESYHRELPENVVEEVFDNSHIDYNTFIQFVHENYPPFYSSIEEASQSLDYLGDSDLFESNKYLNYSLSSYNDMLPKSAISVSLRGFNYSHTQANPYKFFQFIKPRINDPITQSNQFQQLITQSLSTRIQQANSNNISSYQQVPRSILQKSPFLLEIIPIMNSINKSIKYNNNNRNNNSYRLQFEKEQDIPTQIMKLDHQLLLDLCTFKNAYTLNQYNFSKDNQIDSKFVSISINEEDLDEQSNNNNNNNQQIINNNQNQNNNNNINNSNNNNSNKIVSFYGNNEILKYDDIVD